MTRESISISILYSNLTAKVKEHLAVIGKRAKDVNGKSLFSDIITSTAEDGKVWKDFFNAGSEVVVSALAPLSAGYAISTTDTGTNIISTGITFTLYPERWKELRPTEVTGLTTALKNAIEKYIWNYALMSYLDMIHPSTGAKYPPIYASPYQRSIASSLSVIKELAYQAKLPVRVRSPYPSYVQIMGSLMNVSVGEEETLSYNIDYDAIDDIEIRPSNGNVRCRKYGDCFKIKGVNVGECICVACSRHDELNVCDYVHIVVQ